MAHDLIIRGGTLILSDAEVIGDLAVDDGHISALGPGLGGATRAEIDATGMYVLPGGIDVHVHLNDPSPVVSERVESGTRALAAGGVTTLCDMPLNSVPSTVDARAFEIKRSRFEGSSWIDYGLWGGLVPRSRTRLEELAHHGVVGIKAFMATANNPEFERVDDLTLWEGMARCAELGLLLAVHAENADITDGRLARVRAKGGTGAADFLYTRPAIAEVEAITRAITLAEDTCCALHIVHVSTRAGLELVAAARRRNVDVSCETCPQYLAFCADQLDGLGVAGKCQPPLRSADDQRALWRVLRESPDVIVASDHSPAPEGARIEDDFIASWSGIAGAQTTLAAILTRWPTGGLSPLQAARVFATAPAARFGFSDRGLLAIGYRADLVICEIGEQPELTVEDLKSRDRTSPFLGRSLGARIAMTILAGQTVWSAGVTHGAPRGELVSPGGPVSSRGS